MLAIKTCSHICTKLYPNVSRLSLQESLQENISHLLLIYFAFPSSSPALSILELAKLSRAGKTSLPLLFEHCNSKPSRREGILYHTWSCPKHQQRGKRLSWQCDFLPRCLVHSLFFFFFLHKYAILSQKETEVTGWEKTYFKSETCHQKSALHRLDISKQKLYISTSI